jgi:hypothetical protein
VLPDALTEGFVGDMFRTMKPYAAPAPAGAQAPTLWGDEDHVRGLLGDRVTDLVARRRTLQTRTSSSAACWWCGVNITPTHDSTTSNVASA